MLNVKVVQLIYLVLNHNCDINIDDCTRTFIYYKSFAYTD